MIVNDKTNPIPGKTRNQITNERINAINDKNTKQLEILSSKMSNLESILHNLSSNQNYDNNCVTNSKNNQCRNNDQYTKGSAHNYLQQNQFDKNQINSNFRNNRQKRIL